MCEAAKDKQWGEFLLEITDVLYLICNLTQEAGSESVLSAAFSLKHAANMKKGFSSHEEAMQQAKELVTDTDIAKSCIKKTMNGRYTLTVKGKLIKPHSFVQPNADSLIKIAQTEQGRSEVSCVLEDLDNCVDGQTNDLL